MANHLIWSHRALKEFDGLQEYLYEEWGEEITRRVINEIARTIARIQDSPDQFPLFKRRKKIRRCVASPQTSIFFKAEKEVIEILSIFDNRQNPKKRKL